MLRAPCHLAATPHGKQQLVSNRLNPTYQLVSMPVNILPVSWKHKSCLVNTYV